MSIGIVLWNCRAELPDCIAAVQSQDHPAIELIVVDNASADGSLELAIELAPDATVIRHASNLGYGAGQNAAIRKSRSVYHLALNPDVVMEPGYVSRLVAALERQAKLGSATGKLRLMEGGEDEILDSTGMFLDRRRHQILRGHGQADVGQFDVAEEVFGTDGAAALYRKDMLQEVAIEGQFFDEAFLAYNDDIDLAWRARLFGWGTWYDPEARAAHVRRFKPGMRQPIPLELRRQAVRNRYLMIYKNTSPGSLRRDTWHLARYEFSIFLYMVIFERSSLPALIEVLRMRRHAVRWRDAIRSGRTVSDEDMDRWFSRGEELAEPTSLLNVWRALRRAAFEGR